MSETETTKVDDIWMAAIINLKGGCLSEITFNSSYSKYTFIYEGLSEELSSLSDSLELSRGEIKIRLFDLRDEIRRLSNLAKRKRAQLIGR